MNNSVKIKLVMCDPLFRIRHQIQLSMLGFHFRQDAV